MLFNDLDFLDNFNASGVGARMNNDMILVHEHDAENDRNNNAADAAANEGAAATTATMST